MIRNVFYVECKQSFLSFAGDLSVEFKSLYCKFLGLLLDSIFDFIGFVLLLGLLLDRNGKFIGFLLFLGFLPDSIR